MPVKPRVGQDPPTRNSRKILKDGRKGKIRRVRTFSDDGKKMMLRMTGKVGDDEIEEKTVWRRVSSP